MSRTVELVLVVLLGVVFGLAALARRFPGVTWLQVFRYDPPKLSEAERSRIRRRANVYAGVELILLGLVVPLGYVALTVMFFNSFTTTGIVLAVASSLLCVGLGLTAIWRNRRT